ncbi:MAG: hypothetical protein IJV64_06395 [Oscillospiraceae bacterium]|nr:hypothetical protein [Oscillospiraceae bacterium]
MSYDSNSGIARLGEAITGRAKQVNGLQPLTLDFGVIQSDMSLKTNTYAKAIPKTDYSVCRQLTLGPTWAHLTYTIGAGKPNDGTHDHGNSGTHGGHVGGNGTHTHTAEGPHVHDVLIPEKMRSLKPGDRVLVAWVQNEAVIVDLVTRI